MSRTAKRLTGSGTGGAFVAGTVAPPADQITEASFVTPTKDQIDLWLNSMFGRDKFAGGGMEDMDGSAAGTYDASPVCPIGFDNSGNQITSFTDSNGGVLKVQFRFFVWVSNGAISVTPAVYNITAAGAATISGQVACTATAEDFSGSNQQQTVALTLPNAFNFFKIRATIGGTPAPGYRWRMYALFDGFVQC